MALAAIRSDPADALNDAQRLAVEHGDAPSRCWSSPARASARPARSPIASPISILAGADPKRIMLATFSRRAAAELNRRVAAHPRRAASRPRPPRRRRRPTPARSIRSARGCCANTRRGSASIPQFTIHDREDSGRPDELGAPRGGAVADGTTASRPRRPAWRSIRASSTRRRRSARRCGRHFPWAAAHEEALRGLFAAYVEAKQRQRVLDYDDLLLYFAQMLGEPAIAAEIAARFDHLLVDEYQDTNRLQAEIALRLRPRGRGLTVVGDDAQSIYSFRAATVRNILDFPARFDRRRRASSRWSATTARPSRSSPPSNAVIALAAERYAKNLWTERGARRARRSWSRVGEEADQARYRRAARAGEPRGGRDA